jgi:DNA polymerase III sliding clamp (beta) subunit (PCNA family)
MNKFVVNSSILLIALQHVAKVMTKNPTVPILENFLFTIADGVLTVAGSDLQTTFKVSLSTSRHQISCKPDTRFQMTVPREIINYLKKIETQPITFVYDHGKYAIEVLEDDGRAKYAGENPKDFPLHPETPFQLLQTDSDLFKEFSDLLNYVSGDELRPAMTGIAFMQHAGDFQMIATDGHRMKVVTVPELSKKGPKTVQTISGQTISMDLQAFSEYRSGIQDRYEHFENLRMPKGGYNRIPYAQKIATKFKVHLDYLDGMHEFQHFILRSKVATILSGLKFGTAKKPELELVTIRTNEKKENISFIFRCDGLVMEIITSNIDERFPQYWNIIPEQNPDPRYYKPTKFTVDKKPFLKVLDKAELFANRTTHQVRLSLNGSNKISAEDLDFSNEYCAEVGGSYEGEPIEMGFNANFLRDTIKSFGDTFTLEMTAPNKAAVIREGHSLALVMPVMLNQYV